MFCVELLAGATAVGAVCPKASVAAANPALSAAVVLDGLWSAS